jgi:hypothetical protein
VRLNIDDVRRIQQQAASGVEQAYRKAHEQFMQPDIERRELAEYRGFTDAQHARILMGVGEQKYQQYVNAMETLAQRYGGQDADNEKPVLDDTQSGKR